MSGKLSWFPKFAKSLTQRSGRSDWQPPGSEYWLDFERQLAGTGCTAEQADLAISKVCNLPGLYPSDYRPKILEAVRAIRIGGPTDVSLGPVKEAQAASAGCPECHGFGSSRRYVHADNQSLPTDATIGSSFSRPCGSCPFGRHLAHARGEKTWAETDLAFPCKACYRPSQWDEANGRPLPDPDPADFIPRIRELNSLRGPRRRRDATSSPRASARRSGHVDAADATPGRPPAGPDPILDREPQPF